MADRDLITPAKLLDCLDESRASVRYRLELAATLIASAAAAEAEEGDEQSAGALAELAETVGEAVSYHG